MAFEQVIMRTADGKEYGPVPIGTLWEWQQQGRVPTDATLIDAVTWETRPAGTVLAGMGIPQSPQPGAYPPPTGYPAAPSATDHLIPAKNPKALMAYYLGVFGLIPCIAFLGIVALIFGIIGLKDANTLGVGKTHAIVGIVLGSLETLALIVGLILMITGIVSFMA